MKLSSTGTRRLVLGLLGLGLIAAMVFVVMHSGPLAPTRVTVVQAAERRLTPALFGIGSVEARRSYLERLTWEVVLPQIERVYASLREPAESPGS